MMEGGLTGGKEEKDATGGVGDSHHHHTTTIYTEKAISFYTNSGINLIEKIVDNKAPKQV